MSALENAAREVAQDISPSREGDKGFDFISLIPIVVTILQSIVQACPKPPAQVAASLRNPGIMQRAALLKRAKETCEAEGSPQRAREVYRAMLAKASKLTEADALAIVNEAQSDSNLLI